MISIAVLALAPKPPPPRTDDAALKLAGNLLVEDDGSIDELVIQFTAPLEPLVEETYTDFLRALDPATRMVAVVAKPDGTSPPQAEGGPHQAISGRSDASALADLLARIDPSGALAKRVRIVETEGPITVWSKDRALVAQARGAGSRTQLVVPVRPDPRWRERFNDWATLAAIAKSAPEQYVVNEMPLEFDAGDFAVTGDRVIVDDNLLTKNQKRGLTTPQALVDMLARTFQRKIVFLGEKDGDVPRHHLSMYMTPIGGGVVLVGDPRAGRDLVGPAWKPGDESPDTGEALVADFSDASLARFDRAAKDLAAAGFRVERVPVVPFDDKTYLSYTNGVYERRGGRRIAYLPQYAKDPSDSAVAQMDALAQEVYRRIGWDVRLIRVRNAYPFHGTIGCLCNILRRGNAP